MLDLEDYLPYLLNRAGARIAQAFSGELKAHGVTLPVWRVLAALQQRDRQAVGQLAECTSIEISTLSRVLDLMQRQGLVARRRGDGDARMVEVRLSATGRTLARRITPTALAYETIALAGLTQGEAATLKRLLVRVYANMTAFAPERPPAGERPPLAVR